MSVDLTYAQVVEVRQGCDGCWWIRTDRTHHQWMATRFAWMAGGEAVITTFDDLRLHLLEQMGPPYRVIRVADESDTA